MVVLRPEEERFVVRPLPPTDIETPLFERFNLSPGIRLILF
jgi:hypothetical protein